MSFSDKEWMLLKANEFQQQRISFRDSEWILGIANEFHRQQIDFSNSESVLATVGEFSLVWCTSVAHAGNTKIWANIISAYAKKCSITGLSFLRGGGGAKNANIYALSGDERIEKRSDQ